MRQGGGVPIDNVPVASPIEELGSEEVRRVQEEKKVLTETMMKALQSFYDDKPGSRPFLSLSVLAVATCLTTAVVVALALSATSSSVTDDGSRGYSTGASILYAGKWTAVNMVFWAYLSLLDESLSKIKSVRWTVCALICVEAVLEFFKEWESSRSWSYQSFAALSLVFALVHMVLYVVVPARAIARWNGLEIHALREHPLFWSVYIPSTVLLSVAIFANGLYPAVQKFVIHAGAIWFAIVFMAMASFQRHIALDYLGIKLVMALSVAVYLRIVAIILGAAYANLQGYAYRGVLLQLLTKGLFFCIFLLADTHVSAIKAKHASAILFGFQFGEDFVCAVLYAGEKLTPYYIPMLIVTYGMNYVRDSGLFDKYFSLWFVNRGKPRIVHDQYMVRRFVILEQNIISETLAMPSVLVMALTEYVTRSIGWGGAVVTSEHDKNFIVRDMLYIFLINIPLQLAMGKFSHYAYKRRVRRIKAKRHREFAVKREEPDESGANRQETGLGPPITWSARHSERSASEVGDEKLSMNDVEDEVLEGESIGDNAAVVGGRCVRFEVPEPSARARSAGGKNRPQAKSGTESGGEAIMMGEIVRQPGLEQPVSVDGKITVPNVPKNRQALDQDELNTEDFVRLKVDKNKVLADLSHIAERNIDKNLYSRLTERFLTFYVSVMQAFLAIWWFELAAQANMKK